MMTRSPSKAESDDFGRVGGFRFGSVTTPCTGMDHGTPESSIRRRPRNIELRRAVMRVLLRAEAPVRVAEIVQTLQDVDRIEVADARATTPSQRVSNLLGWQVRQGRVRRVDRGVYVAVPEAIPRTTRWRIEHWDRLG